MSTLVEQNKKKQKNKWCFWITKKWEELIGIPTINTNQCSKCYTNTCVTRWWRCFFPKIVRLESPLMLVKRMFAPKIGNKLPFYLHRCCQHFSNQKHEFQMDYQSVRYLSAGRELQRLPFIKSYKYHGVKPSKTITYPIKHRNMHMINKL